MPKHGGYGMSASGPSGGLEIDRNGLAQILARRGIEFAVLELVQNALDADGVKNVRIELTHVKAGEMIIEVEDDSPEGFKDITHAFTLFAPSEKKWDAEKRGRFNLGEKLVIALARETLLVTTGGSYTFTPEGRRSNHLKRDAGTMIRCTLKANREERGRCLKAMHRVLVPEGVKVQLLTNWASVYGEATDEILGPREYLDRWTMTLPTEIADAEGCLRPRMRNTLVAVYAKRQWEENVWLYELGIPVVEIDGPWHVNIEQKVPLNTDRDNVTPAYLRKIRAAVLSHMHESLTPEAAVQPWVDDAMESSEISPEGVHAVIKRRYGGRVVVRDPSDPEANKIAVSEGYTVIEPGSFSKDGWSNIRNFRAALPAGQVTPSPKPFTSGGTPLQLIDPDKWTESMKVFAARSVDLAQRLAHCEPTVVMANDSGWGFAGAWTRGVADDRRHPVLFVNLARLGFDFIEKPFISEPVLEFLLHEIAHQFGEHLDATYHKALSRFGAELAVLVKTGVVT